METNLLDYVNGGGCGCKIDSEKLHKILSNHKVGENSQLFVDFFHKDDASVIQLDDSLCLIQSLDFFLPIVSDPFDFGRIAAANAISDIYAMGGKPITALSILGWPKEKLSLEAASEVLRGAETICKQAGITISGGHSIHTSEPLFGLSVNGLIDKSKIKRNNGSQPGDFLYITKPLGIGLLANAIKGGFLSSEGYIDLIQVATRLNTEGQILAEDSEITAITDITGFGFLGHLKEMLQEGVGVEIQLDEIPVLQAAKDLALQMKYPDITTSNYNAVKDVCEGLNGLDFLWLCDPQTSGGLLFSSKTKRTFKNASCIGKFDSSGKIKLVN